MKSISSKEFGNLSNSKRNIFSYFSRRVLQISSGVEHPDGLVVGLVVALAIAWLICFLALSKGVQSLGKVKTMI